MTVTAETIDQVIDRLDEIIDDCRRSRSRLGYFPSLYRHVTIAVKEGIELGRFEDGPRMERFDVIFANRYLEAFERFRNNESRRRCWLTAFQSANKWRLLILQHLLLGMNAHIGLDLGVAAAHTSPGDQLPALKNDFGEINRILFELVDGVQRRIAEVSPWMGFLDRLGGRSDELIVEFGMERAREMAWNFAEQLAPITLEQQPPKIESYDRIVDVLAHKIRYPGALITLKTLLIRTRESDDVPYVIDSLNDFAESVRQSLFTPR